LQYIAVCNGIEAPMPLSPDASAVGNVTSSVLLSKPSVTERWVNFNDYRCSGPTM
jgi:hypothetical protein